MSYCFYNGYELFMKGIDYTYYYEQEEGVEVVGEGKEENL